MSTNENLRVFIEKDEQPQNVSLPSPLQVDPGESLACLIIENKGSVKKKVRAGLFIC